MKPFDELLGFTVLTGPLWLILLFLPLGVWIAWKLGKRFMSGSTRLVISLGVFLFFFCVLFADEIVGRIYFNHLCATEAGVKVYRTVELPSGYWNGEGKPKFILREGSLEFDEAMLGYQYKRKSSLSSQSTLLHIDRDSYQLIDLQTQSVIGENINFMYWGGWVIRNFSPDRSATSCSRDQVRYFTDVLKQVFISTNH